MLAGYMHDTMNSMPTDPPSIVKLGVECGILPPDQSNSFAITAVAKKTIQHTRKSNLDLFRILAS